MAGTIVTDRIESDASYASSVNIASPLVIANTISLGSAAAITGNVNIDNGTLFVNQNNNRVGIGTVTPARNVHIFTTDSNSYNSSDWESDACSLYIRNANTSTNAYSALQFTVGSNSDAMVGALRTGDGEAALIFGTRTAGTRIERMRISPEGRVTMPSQPAFIATVPTEISIAHNTLTDISQYFTGTDLNRGSHYNTGNGRFTAPVTGLYMFNFKYYQYPIRSSEAYFHINGSPVVRFQAMFSYASNTNPGGNIGSALLSLTANDYVQLYAIIDSSGVNSGLWNGGPRASMWSGYLLS